MRFRNHLTRGNRIADANNVPAPDQKTIILAEDDEELRSLLSGLLKKRGYQVKECINGMELLEHFGDFTDEQRAEKIDLIVSDIRMPGFTGMEILDFLHDNGDFPPVMLITAFGDYRTHAEAERLGVAAFLDKPFDLDEFMSTVAWVLKKSEEGAGRMEPIEPMTAHGLGFPLDIVFRNGPQLHYVENSIREEAETLKGAAPRIIFCRVIVEGHHPENAPEFHFVRMILTVPGKVFVVANDDHDLNDIPDLTGSIQKVFSIAQGKLRKYFEESGDRKAVNGPE